MRKAVLVLAVIGGILAIVGGISLGSIFAIAVNLGGAAAANSALLSATFALGIAAVGIGLGSLLLADGWQALAGRPGRAFTLAAWGWWFLAFIVILILGQALYARGVEAVLPVIHIVAGAILLLLFLALAVGAARRNGQTSARAATGSLAWGGLGGTAIALVVEGVAGLVLLLLAAAWLSVVRPDLLQQLQEWALRMQRSGGMVDVGQLRDIIQSPLVVLGGLAFASVFVPFVEELAKSLAVPLVALTGRRLSRLDGFLIGVAAGAGFALVEGIFNGALGLASQEGWAATMLARGAAAAMHCLASGLLGLAWQAVLTERRWLRAAGFTLLGVALHGAWNAAALGVSLSALDLTTVSASGMLWRNLRTVGIVGFLGTLWLLAVALLAWLPRQLDATPVAPALDLGEEGSAL